MAVALSTQLENLQRERGRLEELLMLDANWRALRQLEEREAAGAPLEAVDGGDLRASLIAALGGNRIFAARAKLVETIELLSVGAGGAPAGVEPSTLASRIVMLSEPSGETFRARLRMKVAEAKAIVTGEPVEAAGPANVVQPSLPLPDTDRPEAPGKPLAPPDPLELIDGLGRRAVETLQDGGVTRFSEIAAWTIVDVGTWRARLDGIALGTPGWWIEQAAVLCSGRLTRHAERARRGEYVSLVRAPEPEPPRPWTADSVKVTAAARADASRAQSGVAGPVVCAVAPTETPPRLDPGTALTAEQLVRDLAKCAVTAPPRLPQAAAPAASAVKIVEAEAEAERPSLLSLRHGYSRPGSPSPAAPGDSDVIVIRQEKTPEAATVQDAGKPRTLLRRLKELAAPGRFEADGYAAYRGSVEEASVTIIRSADGQPQQPAPLPRGSAPAGRAPASRFLKALTGKS